MNNVRTVLLFVFAVGTILAAVAWTQSPVHAEGHLMVLPADLKWSDAPSLPPSAKIAVIEGDLKTPVPFMFRLKVPAGGKIGVHTHPVVEHLTVISGTFNLGIGDTFDPAKATPLGAGSVAIMPPGTPMFAYTTEETIIQVHGTGPWGITYLNLADNPTNK